MKILYITSDAIEKPSCGCAQRSFLLYKALCKLGEVTVFNPDLIGDGKWTRRILGVPFRKLTKVARWPYGPPQLGTYDAVICRYLWSAAEVQAWKNGPCFVDIDDFPLQAYDLVESKRLPRVLRPIGRILVKVWQRYCLSKCCGVWVANRDDLAKIQVKGLKKDVLPNLALPPKADYRVDAPQKRQLMTVGWMDHRPNVEGIEWFLHAIWPKVHARWPDLSYVIAGRGLSEKQKAEFESAPMVKVLGFVEDLDALYAESLAVVAPILSGAGTCIKVIEAGLHGRTCLATPVAARGQTPHEGLALFEDANALLSLVSDWMGISEPERQKRQRTILELAEQANSFDAFSATVSDVKSQTSKRRLS